MNKRFLYSCRVCGFVEIEPPWGLDGTMPSFDYCSCCGVQFGYQDCTKNAIIKSRENWIRGGAIWQNRSLKPKNWILEKQLKNIAPEFK